MEDQGTEDQGNEDQEPADHKMKGSQGQYQPAIGPEGTRPAERTTGVQGDRGPKTNRPQDKDQLTIGPEGTRADDHPTKGAEDQKALEFMLYVSVHRFYIC